MPTDQTKTAKDHKNPSYDSNEDGVVEASQLPAVTGLQEGSMSSGEVLKFDGSGLVGETVKTSDLSYRLIKKGSFSLSGGSFTKDSVILDTPKKNVKAIIKIDADSGSGVNPSLILNGYQGGSNYRHIDTEGSVTSGDSNAGQLSGTGVASGESNIFELNLGANDIYMSCSNLSANYGGMEKARLGVDEDVESVGLYNYEGLTATIWFYEVVEQ